MKELVNPKSLLGKTVTDQITGHKGIVTGYCRYLTGCDQYNITPKCNEGGAYPVSHWIDVGRLTIDTKIPRLVLDDIITPKEKDKIITKTKKKVPKKFIRHKGNNGADMLPPQTEFPDEY